MAESDINVVSQWTLDKSQFLAALESLPQDAASAIQAIGPIAIPISADLDPLRAMIDAEIASIESSRRIIIPVEAGGPGNAPGGGPGNFLGGGDGGSTYDPVASYGGRGEDLLGDPTPAWKSQLNQIRQAEMEGGSGAVGSDTDEGMGGFAMALADARESMDDLSNSAKGAAQSHEDLSRQIDEAAQETQERMATGTAADAEFDQIYRRPLSGPTYSKLEGEPDDASGSYGTASRTTYSEEDLAVARQKIEGPGEADESSGGAGGAGIMVGRMIALLAIKAASDVALSGRQSNIEDVLNAGTTEGSAKSDLEGWRSQFDRIPIVGGIAKMIQDPSGMGEASVDLTLREASDTDAATKAMASEAKRRQEESDRSQLFLAPDESTRSRISIQQQESHEAQQNIEERNAAIEAKTKEHNDRLSEITEKTRKQFGVQLEVAEQTPAALQDYAAKNTLQNYQDMLGGRIADEQSRFNQERDSIGAKFGIGPDGLTDSQRAEAAKQTKDRDIADANALYEQRTEMHVRDENRAGDVKSAQMDQYDYNASMAREQYSKQYGEGTDQMKAYDENADDKRAQFAADVDAKIVADKEESQRKIADITAEGNEALMRASGEAYQADRKAMVLATDDKVAALKALAAATDNAIEKSHLLAEADATEAAGAKEVAAADAEHANAVAKSHAQSQEATDVFRLEAQGKTGTAKELEFVNKQSDELNAFLDKHGADPSQWNADDQQAFEDLSQKQQAEMDVELRQIQQQGVKLQLSAMQATADASGDFGLKTTANYEQLREGLINEQDDAAPENADFVNQDEQAKLAAFRKNVFSGGWHGQTVTGATAMTDIVENSQQIGGKELADLTKKMADDQKTLAAGGQLASDLGPGSDVANQFANALKDVLGNLTALAIIR